MTGKTGRRLLAAALLSLCGCSPAGREPAGDIVIGLEPPTTSSPAFVRVGGLSPAEAEELRALGAQPESLSNVLTVTVQGADVPVVGRTVVNGAALQFHPTFPFDPGRPYAVRLDTSRWRVPRTPATFESVVSLPAPAETARVVVSAIRPSQDSWPENTLRFYVHFSGPMSGTSGVGKVHLVGEDGEDIRQCAAAAQRGSVERRSDALHGALRSRAREARNSVQSRDGARAHQRAPVRDCRGRGLA